MRDPTVSYRRKQITQNLAWQLLCLVLDHSAYNFHFPGPLFLVLVCECLSHVPEEQSRQVLLWAKKLTQDFDRVWSKACVLKLKLSDLAIATHLEASQDEHRVD